MKSRNNQKKCFGETVSAFINCFPHFYAGETVSATLAEWEKIRVAISTSKFPFEAFSFLIWVPIRYISKVIW